MLLVLHRILVAFSVVRARLPAMFVPLTCQEREEMTEILVDQCRSHDFSRIILKMDNIEWKRFYRSLTGTSSAHGVLGQERFSVMGVLQHGATMLEGESFRRRSRRPRRNAVGTRTLTTLSSSGDGEQSEGTVAGT